MTPELHVETSELYVETPLDQTFVHPSATVERGASIGHGTRIWHHAHVRSGAVIGAGCSLGMNTYIDENVVIGCNVKIQNNVSIYRGVLIEDEVFVGPSVVFTNDLYPRARGNWTIVPTTVGRGASLGANATILAGIEVGAWAMVAAGSVVTRTVEPHELIGGNPARNLGWVCRCGAIVAQGDHAVDRPHGVGCTDEVR